jgi:serine/threonine protein kinase
MKYFDNHDFITDYKFSNNKLSEFNTSSFDEVRIKLFDNLFFYVKVLHKAGIILGDINFDNILVDKKALNPILVDIDSVQVGPFFSNTKRDDFIDPSVKMDGYKKHKYFIYTTESDIYSLAAIFYEMVVSSPPHFYQTKEALTTLYKKNIDLSFIDYFLNNKVKLNKHSHEIYKDDAYYVFLERLFFIQKNHPSVFNFFKSIFSEGQRYYFYYKQNRPVNIHKKDGVLEFKEVDLITQSKADPDVLELFIKQFELRIP